MQLKLFPRSKVHCDYGISHGNMPLHTAIDCDTASLADSYDGNTISTVSDLPQSLAMRSSSIPLPSSHVTRTQSEVQLCLDTEEARQRDLDMFYRLVNGLRARHSDQNRMPSHHIGAVERRPERTLPESLARYRHTSATDRMLYDDSVQEALLDFEPFHNESDIVDAWSITGFDTSPDIVGSERLLLGPTESNDDDSGVFELDL